MKNVKKYLIAVAALFLVIFTGSCEIGLGQSVDVNAPTVEVNYPPEGSVIRGGTENYFLLAGKCDDDMGVKNINITITNTSNNSITKSYKVEPQNNEWEKQIVTDLIDGKYVAYVQAEDHYGRKSGIASLSFDLDNTAPQLYLTNPNPDGHTTFGRQVKLAGDLAEDHATKALYVYASENTTDDTLVERKGQEEDGTETPYLFEVNNITEMSNDSPLMIARYYKTSERTGNEEKTRLTNNYLKLYGNEASKSETEKTATKTFYCAVQLEDNALEYKDKTISHGTGRGNISEKYKAYGKDTDHEYVSDTVTTDSSKFVLNPTCNPTYTFDGFELKSDVDARVMSSGSNISIAINAGMDSTILDAKTIKVKLYEFDDKASAIAATPDPAQGKEIEYTFVTDTDKYNKGLQIPNTLVNNKFYRVVCYGKDRFGVDLVPEDDKIYGFQLSATASPPEVTVTSESGNYYKVQDLKDGIELKVHTVVKGNPSFADIWENAERIRFMTTQPLPAVNISGLPAASNSVGKMTYTSGESKDSVKFNITNLKAEKVTGKDGEYNYTMTVKMPDDSVFPEASKGTGKYEFFVVFHDGNKAGSDKFTFNIDNTPPSISAPKIEKYVEKNNSKYINGTVVIKATASDNYDLTKVTYKVYENDDSTPKISDEITSEDIEITVDTTDFSANSTIKVEFEALDAVGNTTPYTTTTETFPYIVDQTTDKPNIDDGNISIGKTYANIVADMSNIFDSTSMIIGKVTDDDGALLNTSTFKIYKKGTTTLAKDATNEDCTHVLENDKAYDYSVPAASGFYDVVIEAFDKTYDDQTKVDNKTNRTSKKTTAIAIDNETPTLAETEQKTEDTKYTKTAKVKFTGTLEDDFPEFDDLYAPKLKAIINGDTANPESITLTKVTSTKWSWTWEKTFTSEANYKIEFEGTDIAGKTAVVTRNICYDKTAPSIGTTVTLTPAGTLANGKTWYNTTTFKVEGTTSDTLSGVKEVYYSIDNGTTWKTLNGCESFQGVINGLSNGKQIQIKAKDNCENDSSVKIVGPLYIDQTAPTSTASKIKYKIDGVDTDFVSYTKAIVLNGSNKLILQGETQDETNGSGVKSVKVKFGNDNFADDAADKDKIVTVQAADISNGVWEAELPAAYITGTGKVYIQMEDNAGNATAIPFVDISFDNQYPEAKISNTKYFGTDTIAEADKVNGKIDINGTAKDNQSITKLELQYKLSTAADTAYVKYSEITEDLLSWKFTVDTADTTKFENEQKYKFRVVATDSSGNVGNSYAVKNEAADNAFAPEGEIEVTINKDSDRPVIRVPDLVFDTGKSFETMTSVVGTHALLYGKKKIYFSVSDDDGVKEIYYSLDNGTNWKEATNSIEFAMNNEGPNAIKFKIVDNQGGTFISDETLSPKLVNEEGKEAATKKSILYIDVDNYNPSLESSLFKTYDGTNWTTEYVTQDKLFFGGKYTKFNLKLSAKDPNGVQKISIKFGGHTDEITKTSPNFRDSDAHEWEFNNIPVDITATGLTDGNNTLEVTITDYAGNVANEKVIVSVDRSPSTLNLDSHLGNGTETLGTNSDFIFKGYLVNADSATKVKYVITNDQTTTYTKDNIVWASAKELKVNTGSGYTWELRADGSTAGDEQYVTRTEKAYKDMFVDLYSSVVKFDTDKYVVYKVAADGKAIGDKYTKSKLFYFHFLVEDAVGNKSVTTKSFKIDPQGDIPTVSISYPLIGSVETVSGKVKAHGKADAKGTHTIVGIYVQIDPNAGDDTQTFGANKWVAKDLTTVKKQVLCKGETATTATPKLSENIEYIYKRFNETQTDNSKKKLEATGNDAKNMYGIYVGNESPWEYMINDTIKLVDSTNTSTAVGIRVYVVDSEGNISETPESDVFIKIDSDVPTIENLKVTQYAWFNTVDKKIYYTKPCTSITASTEVFTDSSCDADKKVTGAITPGNYQKKWVQKDYEENMWLKGNWWLSGSIHDDSDIFKVEALETANATAKEFETGKELTKKDDFADNHKGYTFNYMIGSTEPDKFGTLEYKIKATEKNSSGGAGSKSNTKVITVKFDNKAPKLLAQTSPNFDINSVIVNSNNFYTFGSIASESDGQSGVKYVFAYFTNGTDNANLYDAYWAQGHKVSNLDVNKLSTSGLLYEDNIYWKKGKIANTSTAINNKVVTITAADSNIHKGGLVKIGGDYYVITAYNPTAKTVTLDTAPSSDYKGADIYFAVGHLIDKSSQSMSGTIETDTSKEGYGYHNPAASDDDFIEESLITRANGDAVWAAGINSNNLPDGNMNVNYVVFDEAGNISADVVNGKVSNNAPRIASVRVWCDYNGDGQENVDSDGNFTESETYYYSRASRVISGKETARSTEVTDLIEIGSETRSFMTVKAATYVIPELVGGNGKLYYTYEYSKDDKEVKTTTKAELGNGINHGVDEVKDSTGYYKADENNDAYVIGTEYANKLAITKDNLTALGDSTIASPTYFYYDITDSTPDGALSAKIKLYLAVNMNDTISPLVNVQKFFWEKEQDGKNSLYKGSRSNGHIELEADWEAVAYSNGTLKASYNGLLAGLKDKDPKVSGKITIRGYAYDNKSLSKLQFTFGNKTNTVAAEYKIKQESGKNVRYWESKSADNPTNMTNNGWTFTAEDVYNDQYGHYVKWECNIDTAKLITNKAAADQRFTLVALDSNTTALSSANSTATAANNIPADESTIDETTFHRPSYRMDVVPYITTVTVKDSTGAAKQDYLTRRTALGHYPVTQYTSEHNALSTNDNNTTSGSPKTWAKDQVTVAGFNMTTVTYSGTTAINSSGNHTVTVNSVQSLNNYNYNNSEYNKTPDASYNTTLKDDVIFDVWQFNTKAAISVLGNSGEVDNAVMKINNNNGLVGVAFSNDAQRFNMPGKEGNTDPWYSYRQWNMTYDAMKHNALAIADDGNVFATSVGGDISETASTADKFSLMVSRWERVGETNGANGGANNHLRLETIKQDVGRNKDRIQNPSLAVVGTGTSAKLYLAYYDFLNKEICFRYGVYNKNSKTNFGDFVDADSNSTSDHQKYTKILAHTGDKAYAQASQYVCVGATSGGAAIVIWYDGKDLWYAYNASPTGYEDNTTKNGFVTKDAKKDWSISKIATDMGQYCQLAVDASNNVHIACYDPLATSVKYIYIPSTKVADPGTPNSYTVDSKYDVGQNLTIDVALNSAAQPVPYIGYYNVTYGKPCYAYLADPASFYGTDTTVERNGAVNDVFTAMWECTIVPTPSNSINRRMNVGVRKYTAEQKDNKGKVTAYKGQIRATTDGTSYAKFDRGVIYGNGTANAVMGYINYKSSSSVYFETAQMK